MGNHMSQVNAWFKDEPEMWTLVDDSDDESLLEVGGGGSHHHHHHHHEGEHQVHHNRRGTWAGQEIDARSMTKVDPSLLASLEG